MAFADLRENVTITARYLAAAPVTIHRFVDITAALVVSQSTAGGRSIGVSAETADTGARVRVKHTGTSLVEVGLGGVVAGSAVASDAVGRAVLAVGADFVAGIAAENGAPGDTVTIEVGGGGSGGGSSGWAKYVVSPGDPLAPFTTPEAAIADAILNGHGPANNAIVLLQPGDYVPAGGVLNVPVGLRIVGFSHDIVDPPARILGRINLDTTLGVGAFELTGLDIEPPVGVDAITVSGPNPCHWWSKNLRIRVEDAEAVNFGGAPAGFFAVAADASLTQAGLVPGQILVELGPSTVYVQNRGNINANNGQIAVRVAAGAFCQMELLSITGQIRNGSGVLITRCRCEASGLPSFYALASPFVGFNLDSVRVSQSSDFVWSGDAGTTPALDLGNVFYDDRDDTDPLIAPKYTSLYLPVQEKMLRLGSAWSGGPYVDFVQLPVNGGLDAAYIDMTGTGAGAFTYTLRALNTMRDSAMFVVKWALDDGGAHTLTLVAAAGDTIEGAASIPFGMVGTTFRLRVDRTTGQWFLE